MITRGQAAATVLKPHDGVTEMCFCICIIFKYTSKWGILAAEHNEKINIQSIYKPECVDEYQWYYWHLAGIHGGGRA